MKLFRPHQKDSFFGLCPSLTDSDVIESAVSHSGCSPLWGIGTSFFS